MIPAPEDNIELDKILPDGYIIDRVIYKKMVYDLIIINPEIVPLQIINSENEKGVSFSSLEKESLLFAVNGGIYQENRQSLGYLSINGTEIHSLNRSDGYGNFYLKPNGVFFLHNNNAEIQETEQFYQFLKTTKTNPQLAVQSGPLLVHNNEIHKAFTKGSVNKYVRNGIGIIDSGESELIAIVISDYPVNFYDFSNFFKEFLHCSDALYLDGHISAMYLPALERYQHSGSFGTIIYSLEP